MAAKSFVFRFADVEVREREFSLTKAGEVLAVEPKAFRVLLILIRNPGKLIPKQELLDAVWGDAAVTENSLSRAVALLRKVLGDEARTPRFIETVATVGYRFLGSVETVEDPAALSTADASGAVEAGEAGKGGSRATTAAGVGAKSIGRSRWSWVILAGVAVVLPLAGGFWYLSRPLPLPRITSYTQITHDGRDKVPVGTDGSRLYFDQFSPLVIEQVSVNGGETAPLALAVPAADPLLADISPDGSTALVGTNEQGLAYPDSPIWAAPILGGSAKRLGDGENETFSPDGLSMIYSTVDGDIILSRIDGTEKHRLAHVPSMVLDWSPSRWSPDRKTIRFATKGLLWEMSADGSGLHRLLPDWKEPGKQCCGQWTADGHFYLFVLDSPSTGSQIWALDERRGLLRRPPSTPICLTTGATRWRFPVPSRDGTKIFAAGATPRGELSRGDPRAGVLAPFLGGISAEFVSFSPDGKSLAYVSFPEGTLWKADRDGGHRIQLAGGPGSIYNPRWSPDSKQIVYPETSPDGHSRIYLVSEDGGKPQRLLPDAPSEMSEPNWSPDGKRVLFNRGVYLAQNSDLGILDLGSGQVTIVSGSAHMWSPRWSPDGRYIVAKFEDNRAGLPVFDFKTQRWSTLHVDGNVEFPSFSRDSKNIYFLGKGGVLRIPVAGGKEERVFDLTNWHITGLLGGSMSLDPTDAPLVLRDTGTNDIYALTLEEK